jgi:predicted ATPase with chaperone activity
LAPAGLPKQAASFDLPITLGLFAGSGQLESERFEQYAVFGELVLDGTMRPARGALSMAMAAATQDEVKGLVVPKSSAAEAAVVKVIEVIGVSTLAEPVAFFAGELEIEPTPQRLDEWFHEFAIYDVDVADLRGQEIAKQAMTIAAAGGHNLLMLGPPGSGKSMMAKRVAFEHYHSRRISCLIAALNPCPCGYRNDPRRSCNCTVPQVKRYMSRISGPLLDRIDIHIEVPAVPFRKLLSAAPGTSSAQMREAVAAARAIQRRRFAGISISNNGHMTHGQIRTHCQFDEAGNKLLKAAMAELGLSARAHGKPLRVARTSADLEREKIASHNVSDAINYRLLDRNLWSVMLLSSCRLKQRALRRLCAAVHRLKQFIGSLQNRKPRVAGWISRTCRVAGFELPVAVLADDAATQIRNAYLKTSPARRALLHEI